MIPDLHIENYSYPLTEDRIAKYPLPCRDSSKLLLYADGQISESVFKNLPDFIDSDSLMIFNDTKVVPARLHFKRESGAHIEIFCLQPVEPAEYVQAFAATSSCRWQCVIGNSKRWKDDILHFIDPSISLRAKLVSKQAQSGVVEFSWDEGICFSNILDRCGQVPIPPYLNRETEAVDLERYQTVYARIKGSVAAPTAGLHFTDNVLEGLGAKGIVTDRVCLHVGAGTFLPVKTSAVAEHPMHREPFVVKASLIRELIENKRKLIAVGTTSVRTLESLYYIGVSCIEKGKVEDVEQWAPYQREYSYSTREALQAILDYMQREGLEEISAGTRIIILPGFKFRLVERLITNFHQSESTLILLVAAFVGEDWRKIYSYALEHDFRFLSYGDSSLLSRSNN